MRIIARKTLKRFWEKHADRGEQFKSWCDEAKGAVWRNLNDIRIAYPKASFLKDNRVVFNIKGNSYRLIVKINYKYHLVWIRFIGTQAEYDKVDAGTI